MNPILIYFKEVTLKKNKFKLNFLGNKFVHLVDFSPKNIYYLCSLNCNVNKTNAVYHQTKKKHVDDLSQKSRDLLTKGGTYQNDIGYLTSSITDNYYFPTLAPHKYSLVLDPQVIDDNSYKFKFFGTVDKRIKFAKIYSPFSQTK